MSGLEEAVIATKFGYELDEKSMYDDDMIGHAETITSAHDEILIALAKAAIFDDWMKKAKSGEVLTIDAEAAPVIEALVGYNVGKMLEPTLKAREDGLAQSAGPKI
jgi:hypothetical protein